MSHYLEEHSGKRLESLGREELLALLDLRCAAVKAAVNGPHDCPPNRLRSLCDLVEVANAIAGVRTRDRSASIYSDGIVNFTGKLPKQ